MTKLLTFDVQKHVAILVLGVALCFGMLVAPQTADAQFGGGGGAPSSQSSTDLQSMINQLLQQVQMLQLQLQVQQLNGSLPGPTSSGVGVSLSPTYSGITIGSKVKTTSNLSVRAAANGWLLATVPAGTTGTVVEGPVAGASHTWWKIEYDYEVDSSGFEKRYLTGWSAARWLSAVANYVEPPISCPLYMKPECKVGEALVSKGTGSNGCSLGFQCLAKDIVTNTTGVHVEVVDTEAYVSLASSVGGHGEFEIEMEVTAIDEDIYISSNTNQFGKDGFIGVRVVDGTKGNVNQGVLTHSINSTADEDGSFFRIDEGDTETITITADFVPDVTATYRMEILNLPYLIGQPYGVLSSAKVTDGKTKYVNLNGTGVSTDWTINDVKSITAKAIDPIPLAVDDEYTLYKITLNNGKIYEIKGCGFCPSTSFKQAFYDAGYNGDVDKLISMATIVAPEAVAVRMLTPTGGTHYYGDTLKVAWSQTGSVPKGSKACVTLRTRAEDRTYAFPPAGGCVDIAGEEPTRSVSGVITSTSGYLLNPGDYRAMVNIVGPSSGGKDGTNLANAKSADYITIKAKEVAEVPPNINYLRCNRGGNAQNPDLNWAENRIACLGVWDFGNAFGGDQDMCGGYSGGKTGCEVAIPACASGVAKATTHNRISSASNSKLEQFAKWLRVSVPTLEKHMVSVWEYRCTTPRSSDQDNPNAPVVAPNDDIWSQLQLNNGRPTIQGISITKYVQLDDSLTKLENTLGYLESVLAVDGSNNSGSVLGASTSAVENDLDTSLTKLESALVKLEVSLR